MPIDTQYHASAHHDRTLALTIVLPDGGRFELGAPAGGHVMDAVRAYGFPLRPHCTGACDGQACHARVGRAWIDRLPARSAAELAGLRRIDDPEIDNRDQDVRPLCRLVMTDELDGLELQLTPDCLVAQTYWVAG